MISPSARTVTIYRDGTPDALLKPADTLAGDRVVPVVQAGGEDAVRLSRGTVHVALGAGYTETGNKNQSSLHWDMVTDLRQGGGVEINRVTINADRKFAKDGWPGPS